MNKQRLNKGDATNSDNTQSARGVFERPAESFAFDERVIGWILSDEANPLNRIAQSIPQGAQVLDIGAGNGVLARLLARLGCEVVLDAVEPDLVAREFSSGLYRQMFPVNLEEFLSTACAGAQKYDVIVMADVVEHLANPEPHLVALKSLLTDHGFIALSTPNIAFASVRLALLDGRFDYVNSGILERTHLRFYTLKTLKQLFEVVGLYPANEFHCLRDPLAMEIKFDGVSIPLGTLARIGQDELAFVYQFLFLLTASNQRSIERIKLGSDGEGLVRNYIVRRVFQLLRKIKGGLRPKVG